MHGLVDEDTGKYAEIHYDGSKPPKLGTDTTPPPYYSPRYSIGANTYIYIRQKST